MLVRHLALGHREMMRLMVGTADQHVDQMLAKCFEVYLRPVGFGIGFENLYKGDATLDDVPLRQPHELAEHL